MENSKNIRLSLGVLSPTPEIQFARQGYTLGGKAEEAKKIADARNTLQLSEIILRGEDAELIGKIKNLFCSYAEPAVENGGEAE